VGLPLSWVPPSGYSFPSALSSIEWAHIPQERGGAPVGLSSVVGSELWQRGGVIMMGGRENEPTSTVDVVDVQFKLRS